MAASVREHRSARSVVVGTWPSFAARWLLPRLPALERSHPHLEVSVIVEKRLAVLDSGGLDLAVVMGEGPWPGLDAEPLASWEVWGRAHGPTALDVAKGPRFTSTDLVLRAAGLGQGVALALHRLAADDVTSGHLLRPLGDLSVRLPTVHWILRSPGAPRREAVETLVRWLRREVSLQPGPDAAQRASGDC